MLKRIAFIKQGAISGTNDNVLAAIVKEFPRFEVEVIDIGNLVFRESRSRSGVVAFQLLNRLCAFREFGPQLLLGRKKLRNCLTRTSYFFHTVKGDLRHRLARGDYAFTFQMKSLFDGSIPGVHHFVYTDHASLATLEYPGIEIKDLWPNSWIELERTIYRNARLIFTMGANISNCLVDRYGVAPNKALCVGAGSNTMPLERDDLRRYEHKHILFIGADWRRKGGPILAEAFKAVLKAHPDAQLTIAGASPKLSLPNSRIVGRVPRSEVGTYLDKASLLCLPTTMEPFGIVLIEAFAHKVPVVTTKIGSIPEFVSDGVNGYLVEPNDVDHLAQRLIELLSNPARCRIYGENGYKVAMESYNWHAVGARMREAIDRVLAGDLQESPNAATL